MIEESLSTAPSSASSSQAVEVTENINVASDIVDVATSDSGIVVSTAASAGTESTASTSAAKGVAAAAAAAATASMSSEMISVFQLNKEVLRCSQPDHDCARIKFLCIDSNCKCTSKLACAECILNDHKDHKYFVLERFVEQVADKFTKLAKSADVVEEESRMEEFQAKVASDVRAEFSELRDLVVRSFDEQERECLASISKSFESSKPRMEYREKFTSIASLARQNFDALTNESLTQVVHFHADEKLERVIEDTEKTIAKNKAAISKKKAKYFEKFRAIVADILTNCKTMPLKEAQSMPGVFPSPSKSAMAATSHIILGATTTNASILNSGEKKKRKITFNDEHSVLVFESNNSNNSSSASANSNINGNLSNNSSHNSNSLAAGQSGNSATGSMTTVATANQATANPSMIAAIGGTAAGAAAGTTALSTPSKHSNISELQSYSSRSFASESRRYMNSSAHKKLKTDTANSNVPPASQIQSTQQQ